MFVHAFITAPILSCFANHFETNSHAVIFSLIQKNLFTIHDSVSLNPLIDFLTKLFFLITFCFVYSKTHFAKYLTQMSMILMRVVWSTLQAIYLSQKASRFPMTIYVVYHSVFPSHLSASLLSVYDPWLSCQIWLIHLPINFSNKSPFRSYRMTLFCPS